MSITKKEAAAARAVAAQKAEAVDRLSALEVERRGYVFRGNERGIKAVDDEIAHWSNIAGIPVESGSGDDSTDDDSDDGASETDTDAADGAAPKSRGRAKAAAAVKD
jgi:hypothetical protein